MVSTENAIIWNGNAENDSQIGLYWIKYSKILTHS